MQQVASLGLGKPGLKLQFFKYFWANYKFNFYFAASMEFLNLRENIPLIAEACDYSYVQSHLKSSKKGLTLSETS